MTARRAARAVGLTGAVRDGRGVPPELLDPQHEVWRTDAATQRWATRHRLKVRATPGANFPRRFAAARDAWAADRGLTNRWNRPDAARMRELGVPMSGLSRLVYTAAGTVVGGLEDE